MLVCTTLGRRSASLVNTPKTSSALVNRAAAAAAGARARAAPASGSQQCGLATVAASDGTNKEKVGILMMNMGGPSTLPEVGDFLSRLFHDRELIQLPFQSRLAPLIARRRTPKIEAQYAKIGGGSPILRWTRKQGAEMVKMLDELHPSTAPHKPYVAFRYARPLTEEALDEMVADGITRCVAFTQYPQYSCSTTGSNVNELYRQIQARIQQGDKDVERIRWSVIDRWPTHPGLVHAFANRVNAILQTFPEGPERDNVPIMFSAHSLPMQIVSGRGDPYPAEVAATVAAVMQVLGNRNPYRVTWQSQVGPSAWLGPQTSDTVKGWAKQGHKHAIAVPIAFTQDHIETLYELDIELKEEAEEHGMTLHRAESLNDEPKFLRALADICASHLAALTDGATQGSVLPGELTGGSQGVDHFSQGRTSRQFMLRCPGCMNNTCAESKQFFGAR